MIFRHQNLFIWNYSGYLLVVKASCKDKRNTHTHRLFWFLTWKVNWIWGLFYFIWGFKDNCFLRTLEKGGFSFPAGFELAEVFGVFHWFDIFCCSWLHQRVSVCSSSKWNEYLLYASLWDQSVNVEIWGHLLGFGSLLLRRGLGMELGLSSLLTEHSYLLSNLPYSVWS